MKFIIFLTILVEIFKFGKSEIDPSTLRVTKVYVTYNEALQSCKYRGMKLVSINNAEDNAIVNGFANTLLIEYYWIDGNDNTEEDNWVDSKNNPLTYKNFKPNAPDGGRRENCILVYRVPNGLWNDYYCGSRYYAICQLDPIMDINLNQLDIEGNSFIVSYSRLTYDESQEYCNSRGLKMIRVNNALDNAVVHSFAKETSSDSYWIDATDINKEDQWVYSDGNKVSYKNFYSGEPNGKRAENCVYSSLGYDGFWFDYICNYKYWAICYKTDRKLTIDPNTIFASHERLTFNEADTYCKALELTMVRVNSAAENALVHGYARRLATDLYWLDGNDARTEGHWVNSDNIDLIHKNFYPGQPAGGKTENCLHGYLYYDGLWDDLSCNYKNLYAFCSMGLLQVPFQDEYEINPKNLMVSSESYTYNEALQFCRTRGAQLIRINNENDNSNVAAFAKQVVAQYYWIDGNDYTTEGKWVNSNGKPLVYKKFAAGEPNGQVYENCLYSYYLEEGTWRDTKCSSRYLAICSRN